MADLKRIVKMLALAALALGLAYPLAFAGLARLVSSRADGDIISVKGRQVGARNIGQEFSSPGFFHGRPSAAGDGYDAMRSGGSNLAADSPELLAEVRARVARLVHENPGLEASGIPVEMVTASGSGLDPNVSVESALLQVPRIASSRGIPESAVRELVRSGTHGRFLGVFGQPTVNVLELNVELGRLRPSGGSSR